MAWILGIDMPPIDELATIFIMPNKFMPMLYIDGRAIMPSFKNIIIGDIFVRAFANDATHVSFYVDGKLVKDLKNAPYMWNAKLNGQHEVMVKAFNGNAFAYDAIDAYFIS